MRAGLAFAPITDPDPPFGEDTGLFIPEPDPHELHDGPAALDASPFFKDCQAPRPGRPDSQLRLKGALRL